MGRSATRRRVAARLEVEGFASQGDQAVRGRTRQEMIAIAYAGSAKVGAVEGGGRVTGYVAASSGTLSADVELHARRAMPEY